MSSILIVENNVFLRQSLAEVIKIYLPALRVEEAADSAEALRIINASTPDIIFVDLHLPDGNGPRLTKAVKAACPGMIIAVFSNYDLPEYRYDEYQLTADHLLSMDSLSGAGMSALIKSILEEKEVDTVRSRGCEAAARLS